MKTHLIHTEAVSSQNPVNLSGMTNVKDLKHVLFKKKRNLSSNATLEIKAFYTI